MSARRYPCVDCREVHTPMDPAVPIHRTIELEDWSCYWFPVHGRCYLCSLAIGLDNWAEFRLTQKRPWEG